MRVETSKTVTVTMTETDCRRLVNYLSDYLSLLAQEPPVNRGVPDYHDQVATTRNKLEEGLL